MKKLIKKFNKWFDLNVSWFFINGNKVDEWRKHLIKKYNIEEEDIIK